MRMESIQQRKCEERGMPFEHDADVSLKTKSTKEEKICKFDYTFEQRSSVCPNPSVT